MGEMNLRCRIFRYFIQTGMKGRPQNLVHDFEIPRKLLHNLLSKRNFQNFWSMVSTPWQVLRFPRDSCQFCPKNVFDAGLT